HHPRALLHRRDAWRVPQGRGCGGAVDPGRVHGGVRGGGFGDGDGGVQEEARVSEDSARAQARALGSAAAKPPLGSGPSGLGSEPAALGSARPSDALGSGASRLESNPGGSSPTSSAGAAGAEPSRGAAAAEPGAAEPSRREAAAEPRAREARPEPSARASARGARLLRIRALLRKELRQLFRDPRSKRIVFGAPVIQLLLFGYAVNTDV